MITPIEQVELSCRLRVPATSPYADLIRYLRAHPYKSIQTLLLDAAIAFYLPQALLEVSASTEVLQSSSRQALSALLAQVTLIAVQVNAHLPDGQQLQIPLQDWKTDELAVTQSNTIATVSDLDEPLASVPVLVNPFDFTDVHS